MSFLNLRRIFFYAAIYKIAALLPVSVAYAETIRFPENFKWGVATAAHQIEGDNTNSDHYQWEIAKPDRVISKQILQNRQADNPLNCPIIDTAQDPDLLREHSLLFPLNNDLVSENTKKKSVFCEYSGKAVDHWNRVTEDIKLIKNLNAKWYRFSVEWAKIEPEKGKYNQAALDHYIQEIKELQKAGIEAHVTLFHFTMPQWLRNEGGWESANSPEYFRVFTNKVYTEFARQNVFVPVWYTINEPMVHIHAGYVTGAMVPGEKNISKIPLLLRHILQAHALSYHELHLLASNKTYKQSNIRVGLAHHLRVFEPASNLSYGAKVIATRTAGLLDYVWNWMFIDAVETGVFGFNFKYLQNAGVPMPEWLINLRETNPLLKGTQDFLGLNYYTRDTISAKMSFTNPIEIIVNPEAKKLQQLTDMGWEIYPEGLYKTATALYKRVELMGNRKLPLIISENGIADSNDSKRIDFLKEHLKYLKQAINEGVPIEGYCYWSLMDNYEWNSGYYPQFGLYSVDFKQNMKRIPRKSATFFSEMAKTNSFEY